MSSFCDLSGFKFLTFAQKQEYSQAFQLFNQVQAFNSNISTLRSQGNSNLSYYQFLYNEDKTKFIQGRLIHIQAFPSSNWDFVQQN